MNKLISTLILIALGTLFILFLVFIVAPRQERKECISWQIQEVENNYKPSDWQVEQCSHYNLNFKP